MGRPSKLTDKQWDQIKKRLLAGEKASVLAKEFGVSRATVSERCSRTVGNIKTVAHQVVAADFAFRSLDVSEQLSAISLIDELKSISSHLAGAGKYGAATAHRLSGIAHAKAQEIDDAAPLDGASMDALKGIAGLTRLANEASEIGMNLLKANKEAVDGANKALNAPAPSGLSHFYGESS
jgi:hypothetical protein